MTLFDVIIILIFVVSTLLAIFRGALLELATLLALGISILLGLQIGPFIINAAGNEGSVIATLATYCIAIFILFIFLYTLIHILVYKFPLSERGTLVNRIAGGVFGFARAYIIIGLGFLAYGYYLEENQQHTSVRDAMTLPIAQSGAKFFEQYIPDSAKLDPANTERQTPLPPSKDVSSEGYGRSERAGLNEVITTVTTTEETSNNTNSQLKTAPPSSTVPPSSTIPTQTTPER